MQASPVPFCDGVAMNLRSDEDKARILRDIADSFGIHVLNKSCERYHAGWAPLLRRGGHMVGLRSAGAACLLYMTRYDFGGVCVLVDRRVQRGHFFPRMTLVRLAFDDALFDDTLVDGELVRSKDTGRWVFLASDLLAESGRALVPPQQAQGGRPTRGLPATERIARLQRIVMARFAPDDHDLFAVRVKRYFALDDLRDVVERVLPGLDYDVRGIVFKPVQPRCGGSGAAMDVQFVMWHPKRGGGGGDGNAQAPLRQEDEEEEDADEGDDDAAIVEPEGDDGAAGGDDGEPPEPERRAVLFVRRTGMPDVYELFESKEDAASTAVGSAVLVAGVPSMHASQALAAAFAGGAPPTAVVPLTFRFDPRFGRWIPAPSI